MCTMQYLNYITRGKAKCFGVQMEAGCYEKIKVLAVFNYTTHLYIIPTSNFKILVNMYAMKNKSRIICI